MPNGHSKSKEIQKQPTQVESIQSAVPDYLRKNNGTLAAGLENLESRDMLIPRLSLCQSGSPQRKTKDVKWIEGLQEQDWFNSVTQEVYGRKVKVVPLMFFKTRVLFKDFDQGGGLLCISQDNKNGVGEPGGDCATCPKSQFQGSESPECSQNYSYAVLVVPSKGPITPSCLAVLSFKSTGLKVAREWNAKMRLRGTDSFAGVYEIHSAEESNKIGQWFTPVVQDAGWVTEQQYAIAQECYAGVRELQSQGKLKVDTDEREPGDEVDIS